jgi:hypothetical protein
MKQLTVSSIYYSLCFVALITIKRITPPIHLNEYIGIIESFMVRVVCADQPAARDPLYVFGITS